MLSHVRLFVTPRTVALQAPLSLGFFFFFQTRILEQFVFPIPGDLLDPGIELTSLVSSASQADCLPLHHLGSPKIFTEF